MDDAPGIEELARAHNEGDVTIRQIATLTGLSHEETCEAVEALYEDLGLGDDDPSPETYTPCDFEEEDVEAFREAMQLDRDDVYQSDSDDGDG